MNHLPIRDRAQINRDNAFDPRSDAQPDLSVNNSGSLKHPSSKSTGPKTPEGKDRVRFNATRHGLTGQVVVLPADDLIAYDKHTKSFHDSLQPKGPIELRVVAFGIAVDTRDGFLREDLVVVGVRAVDLPQGVGDGLDEVGFEQSFAVASVVAKCTKDLANLSLCQHRAYGTFEKAHDRLLMLQEKRREQERAQMAEARRLLALHEAEEEERREAREEEAGKAAATGLPSPSPYVPVPYDPKEDGFVLQLAEITANRDRKERLDQAYQLPRYAAAA